MSILRYLLPFENPRKRKWGEGNRIYQSLDPLQKQIRLLHVDTSGLDRRGRVKCRLETVSLLDDSAPAYEAISWCWGDASKKSIIVLDGNVIEIPQNAEEVLRCLCVEQKHARIWLDALCINQADLDECGHQVSMMKDVYSMAERVLIWLGRKDNTTELAMRSIDLLVNQCEKETRNSDNLHHYFVASNVTSVRRKLPFPSDIDFDALARFYSSSWFYRLWTVQEVLLSKVAICFQGRHSRLWDDIGLAAQWMHHRRYNLTYKSHHGISNAAQVWRRSIRIDGNFSSLLELGLYHEATRPHDKVYALLGLAQRNSWMSSCIVDIVPDYRLELKDVYTAATRAAIAGTKRPFEALDILRYAQRLRPPKGKSTSPIGWPSWVPRYDWSDADSVYFSRIPRGATNRLPAETEVDVPSGVLRAKGVMVDRIVECSVVFTEECINSADTVSQAIAQLASFARSRSIKLSTLMMPLCASMSSDGVFLPSNDHFGAIFEEFIVECERNVPNSALDVPGQKALQSKEYFSGLVEPYWRAVHRGADNRRIFFTDRGHVGLGPSRTEKGDRLCILFGASVPFVLRQEDGFWRLIGDACVDGLMEGEYIQELGEAGRLDTATEWFAIH